MDDSEQKSTFLRNYKMLKNRFSTLLAESGNEWGISTRLAAWCFWIPIVGAVVMAMARIDKRLYRFLLADDGVVEWGQFVLFALACLAGAGVAARLFAAALKWQGVVFSLFALAMFFIAGEEVAWGQRIIGLKTPERLNEVNAQHEITVHNIGRVQDVFNVGMMLGSGLALLLYGLNRRVHLERYVEQANYLFTPPFFLVPAFGVVFLYKLLRFTVWPVPGFTVTKYAEWIEFCLAFAFCVFAWLNYRRLAREQRSVPLNHVARPCPDEQLTNS